MLLALEPLWRNPFENPTTAQFIHRWLAMLVALTVLISVAAPRAAAGGCATPLDLLGGMVAIQIMLGISTLILVVPVPLAAMHQAGAVMVLTLTLWALHSLRGAR